jgi:hypothetical protein
MKPMKIGLKNDTNGDVPVSNTHATPHQKTLPVGLGTTKAAGMGKTVRIGLKKAQDTELNSYKK